MTKIAFNAADHVVKFRTLVRIDAHTILYAVSPAFTPIEENRRRHALGEIVELVRKHVGNKSVIDARIVDESVLRQLNDFTVLCTVEYTVPGRWARTAYRSKRRAQYA